MQKKTVNFLALVPVPAEHITTEKAGELSVITFPRFRSKFMQRYFVPKNKSPFIHIKLDKNGTVVWDMIDGKKSVAEIVEALSGYFNHEENYEYRISAYLSQLQKQGFLKLQS
jgi:hypothetical protein